MLLIILLMGVGFSEVTDETVATCITVTQPEIHFFATCACRANVFGFVAILADFASTLICSIRYDSILKFHLT